MNVRRCVRTTAACLGAGAGLALGAYAAYVAWTWRGYGRPSRPSAAEEDPLLDRFLPTYDVVERHHVQIEAPAAVTLLAAKNMELSRLPIVRAIFAARGLMLGGGPQGLARHRGIVDETRSLGWVLLDEIPDREIVMGAVTKPWEADVTFRSIAPELFADFDEPGYVKIAWTLRADPIGERSSIFRTETRVLATDAEAKRKFRAYWSCLSPGILLIRRLSLAPLKSAAERQAKLDRKAV